jgi:hypothetical protein
MLTIPITHTDYEGNVVTKKYYFNLTKKDILKINFELPGGFEGFIEKLKTNPTWDDIQLLFDKLILSAYGIRNEKNKFIKSEELRAEFEASDAYSELFLRCLQNEDNFIENFITGVMNLSPDEMKSFIENNNDVVISEDNK